MISRISSIIVSHPTAIPSDEGRVYSLYRTPPVLIRPAQFQKDSYSDFLQDRFPQITDVRNPDKAANSSLYGYGMTLYAASLQNDVQGRNPYRMIIRA